MSRWLSLAKGVDQGANAQHDTLTKVDKSPDHPADQTFCPVLSGRRAENTPEFVIGGGQPTVPVQAIPEQEVNARFRRTWTGRVVSPADWQSMSHWDRHGSDGRLFCGICWDWVSQNGTCPRADCWRQNSAPVSK